MPRPGRLAAFCHLLISLEQLVDGSITWATDFARGGFRHLMLDIIGGVALAVTSEVHERSSMGGTKSQEVVFFFFL